MKVSKFWSLVIIFSYIALVAAVLIIGPQTIIDWLGTTNTLIGVFIFAFVAGSSSFSSTAFYVLVAGLAVGGLPPWLLALAGGPGLIAGDILHFFLGDAIESHLPAKVATPIKKAAVAINSSRWRFTLQPIIFTWAAVVPLPVDLLMLGLAMIDYPFKKLITPLVLGEFAFMWLLATLALAAA